MKIEERRIKEQWRKRATLWLDARLDDFAVTLPAIASVDEWEAFCFELMTVLNISETEMINHRPIVYRGNGGNSLCNMENWPKLGANPVETLNKMLGACRRAMKQMIENHVFSGSESNDRDLFWLMRHAGLLSPLLDFSKSFYVALWFAIHDKNGCLRNEGASVWVVRLSEEELCDVRGDANPSERIARPCVWCRVEYDENGDTPYYRPMCQDSIVIRQRFLNDGTGGLPKLLPLNQDPYFVGRIVRIPIQGDYAKINKDVERLLMKENENHGTCRYDDDLLGLKEQTFYQSLQKAGESCYQSSEE